MDLLAPSFDVVAGRPAYDVSEVDDAVAETRRLLAGHPPSPGASRGGFTLTREAGYDVRQVDAWRDAVRRELARRGEGPGEDPGAAPWDDEVPPELRGVPDGEPARASTTPAWVRLTALVLIVSVALFFVASYFV